MSLTSTKLFVMKMMHSPIHNYVIPGLSSYLVGSPSEHGTMRAFHCTRQHQERIIPHSHRFDFMAWVLQGTVQNIIWDSSEDDGDEYQVNSLVYHGDVGKYEQIECGVNRFTHKVKTYAEGDCYSMKAEEVHSISFSKDSLVLFFEGPVIADRSIILQPYVDGKVIPTFKVEDWMFKRESTTL